MYVCFNALSKYSKNTVQQKKGQFGDMNMRKKVLGHILFLVGRFDLKEFKARPKDMHSLFKYCFNLLSLVIYDFEPHQLNRYFIIFILEILKSFFYPFYFLIVFKISSKLHLGQHVDYTIIMVGID